MIINHLLIVISRPMKVNIVDHLQVIHIIILQITSITTIHQLITKKQVAVTKDHQKEEIE